MRNLFLFFPAVLTSLTLSLQAQDAKNFDYQSSANSGQSAAETEDIGEIGTSGGGGGKEVEDKSMPEAEPLKSKFRFSVSSRGSYTTNSKLSGNHSSSDFILLPSVEGGYNTPLGEYFTFDLALKLDSAVFADNGDRGFIAYSSVATLDFRPRPALPRVFISAEPYRYDRFDTGSNITQAIGFSAGTDWGFAFNQGRSLAYAGYIYSYYAADPTIDNRNTHRLTAGVAHQFRSDLNGQLYYSWQHSDFTAYDRDDSRHVVGANLIYQFSERWFGTFTSSFIDNDSSQGPASYQAFATSFGLTLQF